jgi:hypothetical protein
MTSVALADLDALATALAGDRHDSYSRRALARAFEEFSSRQRPPLAEVTIVADGRPFPSLAAFLADPTARFDTGELKLGAPPSGATAWRFLVPFDRMVFAADGSVELVPPDGGAPVHGIARVLLREHYQIRSESEENRGAAGGSRVELKGIRGTVAEAAAACRDSGVVPFGAAVLVYLPEERVRYEFDAVRGALLPDPRAGRLSPSRRTRRTARLSWALDQYVARSDLSQFGARCLEVLVESPGLTSVELSHVFGGVRELVDSTLQGLVQRRLVAFDPRTGLYRARLEAFDSGGPAVRAEPGGPPVDPSLRTSVQELIAAADARATCPLCGRALPPGPKSILCADCAARVASA